MNQTVPAEKTIVVAPGKTFGPLDFIYMFIDWESTFDDQGMMSVYFENKLLDWEAC